MFIFLLAQENEPKEGRAIYAALRVSKPSFAATNAEVGFGRYIFYVSDN